MNLEETIKAKFNRLSNNALVSRINGLPDFKWDDEGYELNRRIKASQGAFKAKMIGNTIRIIKDAGIWQGMYNSGNGKTYYNVGLDLTNKEFHIFKNFSCDADITAFCKANDIKLDKLYFNDTESVPKLTHIPKKYHSLFTNKKAA